MHAAIARPAHRVAMGSGRPGADGPGAAVRAALQRAVLIPALRAWSGAFTVEGADALDGLDGPLIFAANHASHLDAPAVIAALPAARRRRVRVAAAEDYFYASRVRRWALAALLAAYPFRRDGDVRGSIARTEALLRDGRSVLIFPEGTRSPDGVPGPFREGVALIAARAGVPVVPVHVDGAAAAWPKGARRPRRGPLGVRFGEPIAPPPRHGRAAFTEALRERVVALGAGAGGA